MARKNVLEGLMKGEGPTDTPETRVNPAKPRYKTGAIGAVSQSITELKRRSVVDIDPTLIDNAGLLDRLDEDDGIAALMESIERYGQQVPVLLRPHPEDDERYQVVYGRRRVTALNRLKLPVKAMIRDLDDRDLIMAQGQENAARRDLTFIEKANFAWQMHDAGYRRDVICDALHVDKTVISRMLSIADRVGQDLIHAIGAAPAVGRDRWMKLAELVERIEWDPVSLAVGKNSDARFDETMRLLEKYDPGKPPPQKPKRPPAPPAEYLKTPNGKPIAEIKDRGSKVILTIDRKKAEGFDHWLVANLAEIHRSWKEQSGE
ncbi:MAG TPA: plasmid partitioning protein RepB [Rhodobacterales bacterium]|nr:plasmid partitioning protein RepB [Rhodobacterales bacterium]